jgi:hypothetical protein
MKWITREKVKVDRVACPWLIRKFIDAEAEFLFVPADGVIEAVTRSGGCRLPHQPSTCFCNTTLAPPRQKQNSPAHLEPEERRVGGLKPLEASPLTSTFD